MTTVSGESEARSGSAITPSFIWRRTAKSGSLVVCGTPGIDGRRETPRRGPDDSGRTPRDWLAGPGSIRGEDSAGADAPAHDDPDLADAGAGRCRGKRAEQLGRPEAELLGDDRCVSLDRDRRTGEPDDAADAHHRRHALGDELVEDGHRP